jgi:hypothetical protein
VIVPVRAVCTKPLQDLTLLSPNPSLYVPI